MALVSSVLLGIAVFLAAICAGDVWDRVATRYLKGVTPQLEALRIDQSRIPLYMRWWGIALLLSAALALVAAPLAVAATYLAFIAPTILLSFMIERRRRLLRDQLVSATVAMANACRAGLSLPQGIRSVCKESPEPLKSDLGRIADDVDRGLPLPTAITNVKARLNLDSFTLFAAAILTALERGGKIPEALERISHSLQEVQRLERKIDAETASGRKTVFILSVFPLFFLGLFVFLYPEGTLMVITTFSGQVVLLLVIALVYVSARWSLKILAVDF